MPCTRIYWTSQNDIISPEETEETECELSASESLVMSYLTEEKNMQLYW